MKTVPATTASRRRYRRWHEAPIYGGWYRSVWGVVRFPDPKSDSGAHATIIDPTLSAADRELVEKWAQPVLNPRFAGIVAGIIASTATVVMAGLTGWPSGALFLAALILAAPAVGALACRAVAARNRSRSRGLPDRLQDKVVTGSTRAIMAAATRIGDADARATTTGDVDMAWRSAWDDLTREDHHKGAAPTG